MIERRNVERMGGNKVEEPGEFGCHSRGSRRRGSSEYRSWPRGNETMCSEWMRRSTYLRSPPVNSRNAVVKRRTYIGFIQATLPPMVSDGRACLAAVGTVS
jgi:hypothetical protein